MNIISGYYTLMGVMGGILAGILAIVLYKISKERREDDYEEIDRVSKEKMRIKSLKSTPNDNINTRRKKVVIEGYEKKTKSDSNPEPKLADDWDF